MRLTLAFVSAVLALAYAQDTPVVDDVAPELDSADLADSLDGGFTPMVAGLASPDLDLAAPLPVVDDAAPLPVVDDAVPLRVVAAPPTGTDNSLASAPLLDAAPPTGIDIRLVSAPLVGLPNPLKCCQPMPVEPCPKGLYGKCCGDGNWWCQNPKKNENVCDSGNRRGTYNVCGDTVPTYRPQPTANYQAPPPPLASSVEDDGGASGAGAPDVDSVPVVDLGAEDVPVADDLADLVNNGQ